MDDRRSSSDGGEDRSESSSDCRVLRAGQHKTEFGEGRVSAKGDIREWTEALKQLQMN